MDEHVSQGRSGTSEKSHTEKIPAACHCGSSASVLRAGRRVRVYCKEIGCFIGPATDTHDQAVEAWDAVFNKAE